PMSIGMLANFVPSQSDGWQYSLDALGRFFEHVLTRPGAEAPPATHPLTLSETDIPTASLELMGEFTEAARLLGRRTAELHVALASDGTRPDFAPEPYTDHYRQGLYHGLIGHAGRALAFLRQRVDSLTAEAQAEARRLLERDDEIRTVFRPIRDQRINTLRVRVHGDFNLRQVLYTGKDFTVID